MTLFQEFSHADKLTYLGTGKVNKVLNIHTLELGILNRIMVIRQNLRVRRLVREKFES